jgi:hypothetical protein
MLEPMLPARASSASPSSRRAGPVPCLRPVLQAEASHGRALLLGNMQAAGLSVLDVADGIVTALEACGVVDVRVSPHG